MSYSIIYPLNPVPTIKAPYVNCRCCFLWILGYFDEYELKQPQFEIDKNQHVTPCLTVVKGS